MFEPSLDALSLRSDVLSSIKFLYMSLGTSGILALSYTIWSNEYAGNRLSGV